LMLQIDHEFLTCCAGNAEAAHWLRQWQGYVHCIDDQVDGDVDPANRAEHLLETLICASELYTHPFFVKHAAKLQLLVAVVTNAYADSVAFERSPEQWKRDWADHYRHVSAEVALAVAYLCGGWQHMRKMSTELRSICHWQHHDPEGKAV